MKAISLIIIILLVIWILLYPIIGHTYTYKKPNIKGFNDCIVHEFDNISLFEIDDAIRDIYFKSVGQNFTIIYIEGANKLIIVEQERNMSPQWSRCKILLF